ncbi:hypothetical protein [Parabacteroides sp. FAFU027]|uniref:hypothetical protein n=1 Tax=Parabacteroides sp. FAFU027 TaxID=2922715 RepID=UPI001FAE9B0C|nr:hypothetical protein [Parabacteroides sp. FAFU027]
MDKVLQRLIVPKTVLIGMGAALWGFAAIRILILGETAIGNYQIHPTLNYLIGIAGFVPFFWFVFRKVSNRYASRILALPRHKSHLFAFLDRRGYIMMTIMISMGIGIKHVSAIPEVYKGTFFISLGLSLLASSIVYIVRGVQYLQAR